MTAPFPDAERRIPRGELLAILGRRLAALDACSRKTLPDRYLYRLSPTSETEIDNVWVFGSLARGAKDCGDIDLLVDHSGHVLDATLRRAFFNHPRIRILCGRLERNPLLLNASDCAHVWSRGEGVLPAFHAMCRGEACSEGPPARVARTTDTLVFRLDQLGLLPDHAESVALLAEAGFLSLRYTPLSALPPPDFDALARFTRHQTRPTGEQGYALASLISFAASVPRTEAIADLPLDCSRGQYRYRGFHLLAGTAVAEDSDIALGFGGEWLLMPLRTQRGPNGILQVSRTDRHPLRSALPAESFLVPHPHFPADSTFPPSICLTRRVADARAKRAGTRVVVLDRSALAEVLDAWFMVDVVSASGRSRSFGSSRRAGLEQAFKMFGPSDAASEAEDVILEILERGQEQERGEMQAGIRAVQAMFAARAAAHPRGACE